MRLGMLLPGASANLRAATAGETAANAAATGRYCR